MSSLLVVFMDPKALRPVITLNNTIPRPHQSVAWQNALSSEIGCQELSKLFVLLKYKELAQITSSIEHAPTVQKKIAR